MVFFFPQNKHIFIEVYLTYNSVLVSGVQQSGSDIYMYIYIHIHTHTHMHMCCTVPSHSVVLDSGTPWSVAPDSSLHGDSPGKNTGMDCHVLLQWIIPTQRSNPGLPQCRQILCYLSHQGCPRILEWVAYPFSRGSSQPRNRRVSCIADQFSTNWATREAMHMYVYITFFRSFSL